MGLEAKPDALYQWQLNTLYVHYATENRHAAGLVRQD